MNAGLQLKDIEQAVIMYYSRIELSNSDIKELFGCGNATALKMKRIAKEKALAEEYPIIDSRLVPTKVAYEAWNLDIDDLENRLKKLKKYRR